LISIVIRRFSKLKEKNFKKKYSVMSISCDEKPGPETAINRSIFAYRDRSLARATAVRRNLPEGRSYISQGSNCNLADNAGADRKN